jgi:anion-transporting  ArsA/GET3 family ATPase
LVVGSEIKAKLFEIFSGTGGVGKTTLATARALQLVEENKKVLLITIDPAKRLKQVLNIDDSSEGIKTIKVPGKEHLTLDVILMNPMHTIKAIAEINDNQNLLDSYIVKVLSRPYGGMNEIFALVELYLQLNKGIYDYIVLDTPPGAHFIDFLEGAHKINAFFDQSFIEIFNYLGKKIDNSQSSAKKLMTFLISSGVKKLLTQLNKVTGETFVNDFVDAIIYIYQSKDIFIKALEIEAQLKSSELTNWYVVTSVEQGKVDQAMDLLVQAQKSIGEKSYLLLNKTIAEELFTWEPKEEFQILLKQSLIEKENKIRDAVKPYFNKIISFKDILTQSPLDQVTNLMQQWEQVEANYGQV